MVFQEALRLFPESDVQLLSLDDIGSSAMPIMHEIIWWLEKKDVDCTSLDVIKKVQTFSNFCINIKQPEDDEGCHIFTAYAVSFLEDLFTDKLHVLVPHIETKSNFIKNEDFYQGYCSVSEEMYNKVLRLYSEK